MKTILWNIFGVLSAKVNFSFTLWPNSHDKLRPQQPLVGHLSVDFETINNLLNRELAIVLFILPSEYTYLCILLFKYCLKKAGMKVAKKILPSTPNFSGSSCAGIIWFCFPSFMQPLKTLTKFHGFSHLKSSSDNMTNTEVCFLQQMDENTLP